MFNLLESRVNTSFLVNHRFKQPCVSCDEPADLMAVRGPLSVNTACHSLMVAAWKSQLAPCDYAEPENNREGSWAQTITKLSVLVFS